MEDHVVDTWAIHNRVNLYLLDAIPEEALAAAVPGCRTVHAQLAHVHNVRLMWLKAAAPGLMEGLEKLDPNSGGTKEALRAALEASGLAIAELLRRAVASGGRVKGFRPHATAFLGYLIAHESHHRGQVGWTLKLTGRPLDRKAAFGLWEWGTR